MPWWRFLALVLIAIGALVAVAVWYFPATADFRSRNPFWNGLEAFGNRFQARPLSSLADLPPEPQGTLLVVIPYVQPSTEDVGRLKAYVERGGTLVLADDFGFGTGVLEGLGLPVRFSRAPLLDPLFNYRDKWFPLATELAPSPLTEDISTLALNYATVLQGDGIKVVASSSPFSYLDLSGNGAREPDEPVGPFPVIGHTSVGQGQLVLVSDPSMLIRGMLDAEDNARFARNLVGIAGSDAAVFLDQAHLPPSRLDEAKGVLATVREGLARPVPLTMMVAMVVIVLMAPLWRQKGVVPWKQT
ncbi:MAG: DUF4350 domain-containing protein [Dehalococcoidia bacterium]